MIGFNMVCGLPRAGSTLLCNLLNQNPSFYASSTSSLAGAVAGVSAFWSNSPEIKSDLIHDKEATEFRMKHSLDALAKSWYQSQQDKTVFDKSRAWMTLFEKVEYIWPEGRLFCCIRDPREVFASILRRDKDFPILSDSIGETMYSKADKMFAPNGLIGGPIIHIENSLRCRAKNVFFFPYEGFVGDPERELRKLYGELKLDYYNDHNFEEVKNVATDCDALYLNKFPHNGEGKVEQKEPTWPQTVSSDLAKLIIEKFPVFCQTFGYQ